MFRKCFTRAKLFLFFWLARQCGGESSISCRYDRGSLTSSAKCRGWVNFTGRLHVEAGGGSFLYCLCYFGICCWGRPADLQSAIGDTKVETTRQCGDRSHNVIIRGYTCKYSGRRNNIYIYIYLYRRERAFEFGRALLETMEDHVGFSLQPLAFMLSCSCSSK